MPVKSFLEKLITTKKPLVGKYSQDDRVSIAYDGSELLDIRIETGDYFVMKVRSDRAFKFISPDMGDERPEYVFDCSQPDPGKNLPIDAILIGYDGLILAIDTEYSNDLRIRKNDPDGFEVTVRDTAGLKLGFTAYDDLSKYLKSKNRVRLDKNPGINLQGIGIVLDFEKTLTKDINFSRIKRFFHDMPVVFMIKNFKALEPGNEMTRDVDGFVEKMRLNGIKFFMHCRIRNSGIETVDGTSDMEIASCRQENIREMMAVMKPDGIYADTMSDNVCRPFPGVKKQTCSFGDTVVLTDIPSGKGIYREAVGDFYLRETNGFDRREFELREQFFLQSYPEVFSYFNDLNPDRNPASDVFKAFLLMFVDRYSFIDYNLIYFLIKNDKLRKTFFDMVTMKRSLKIFMDEVRGEYVQKGQLPVRNIRHDGDLKGMVFGERLFLAAVSGNPLDRLFYIPTDGWYCIGMKKILKGHGFFSYKGGRDDLLVFQKSESVVATIPSDNFSENDFSRTLNFNMYVRKNLNVSIIENADHSSGIRIVHKFSVKFMKNKISIRYSSAEKENLSRFFVFAFVDEAGMTKMSCNGRRIISKREDDVIEFGILNRTNEFDIVIE
jgi:hypothetical protein